MVLTKSILIYFLGKLIPALSSLVIMFLGLRYLGKSEFGKYNLILNTSVTISTFMIGWIQQSMLRFNSATEIKIEKKYFEKFTAYASIFAFLVMLAASNFYFKISFFQCMTIALFTFTFCVFSVLLTGYQSQLKSFQYVTSESIYYFIVISI